MISLDEFRKNKEGRITPKALIEHLLANIDQVDTVGYVIKKKDGIIDAGWSETTHLEALGLYELGKNRIIFDMGEDEPI